MQALHDGHFKVVVAALMACGAGFFILALISTVNLSPIFFVIVILGLVLCFMAFSRPELCFFLVLLSRSSLDTVLQKTQLSAGGMSVGFGAVLNLLVIVLGILFYARDPAAFRRVPLFRHWLFFLSLMTLAAFYASDKGSAFKLLGNFYSYYAIFAIPFFLVNDRKDRDHWLKVFGWSFVIPIMITTADFITGGRLSADAGARFQGPFTHPNILAFYLVLAIAMAMYVFKKNCIRFTNGQKVFILILVIDAILELFATKTRNAWLSLWFMLFCYGLLKDRRFIFASLIIIPLALFLPDVQQRVMELFTTTHRSLDQGMNSWEWRVALWQSSWESILRSPLFGHGLTSFQSLSVQFFESKRGVDAHNTYLQILFETGIVGLTGLFVVMGGLWNAIFRVWKSEPRAEYAVVLAYLVCYGLTCFADNLLFYLVLNWSVLFFLGLVLRDAQLSAEKAA